MNAVTNQTVVHVLFDGRSEDIALDVHLAQKSRRQGHVLYSIDAQHHHGLLQGGDLLWQAKIGRVDHMDHLGGKHGIQLDNIGQVLSRCIDVIGHLVDFLDDR